MTNTQIPSYSGVTINISNPTVNANQYPNGCPTVSVQPTPQQGAEVTNPISQPVQPQVQTPVTPQQAYPPSYYLNNYNYQQNGAATPPQPNVQVANTPIQTPENTAVTNAPQEDLSKSSNIINDLDEKNTKQKELEENGKETRIVALTDEYIMSLENYLNNQNTDIRLMAAKEVLTRLDEDKTRFDDAALNALLNKMLQDPQKIIRTAALSAFSSGLACGNDYTTKLLNDIQQNPNSDKDDVVEAANILLRMSADTEIKYTPAQEKAQTQPEAQAQEQEQMQPQEQQKIEQ